MSVNLLEKRVIEECLLVNTRTLRVNFKSFSEVSSSSSSSGADPSGLAGRLGFLVSGVGLLLLLLKIVQLGAERNPAAGCCWRRGKSPKRWGGSRLGVMIVGTRLQTIGAVILGAFTLQLNVILSKSSGAVLRAVGGGSIVKFVADAAIGTVGGQGINVLPLCWKSKLGRVGWEGGGGGGKQDKSWRSCWRNNACWSGGQVWNSPCGGGGGSGGGGGGGGGDGGGGNCGWKACGWGCCWSCCWSCCLLSCCCWGSMLIRTFSTKTENSLQNTQGLLKFFVLKALTMSNFCSQTVAKLLSMSLV
jgi:hypothetical protein